MLNKRILIIIISTILLICSTAVIAKIIIIKKDSAPKKNIIEESTSITRAKELMSKCPNRFESSTALDQTNFVKTNKTQEYTSLKLNNSDSKYLLSRKSDNRIYLNSEYFLENMDEADLVAISDQENKTKLGKIDRQKFPNNDFKDLILELIEVGILKTFIHAYSEGCITETRIPPNHYEIDLLFIHTYFTNRENSEPFDVTIIVENDGTIYAARINDQRDYFR